MTASESIFSDRNRLQNDSAIGHGESVKSVSDIFSPVTGIITKVNKELPGSPERLNEDPYGKGWLARIGLIDFKKDMEKLLAAAQYADYIKQWKHRLNNHLA